MIGAMIEEHLDDRDRRKLIELCIQAMPLYASDDPDLAAQMERLIAKLSGTDTVVVARRAYASRRT